MSEDSSERQVILAVNPGSTSTKVAVFSLANIASPVATASLAGPESLESEGLWGEFSSRLAAVRAWMESERIDPARVSAVVGRGGLLNPLEGGTYRVSPRMLEDARAGRQGSHASNLGCALAQALAEDATRAAGGPLPEVPAYVVDPVSTDEFDDLARFSGLKEISRKSLSHALSIHATVREVCRERGWAVAESRLVVAHLGGGISVCPVRGGKILDANNANSGGPFSPTRAGGLPTQELLTIALSGTYSREELRHMTLRAGGLMSYLGTGDAMEVEQRMANGDAEARTVFEAMAYQIAKEIGAMATTLNGDVQRIVLTGGLASSRVLTDWIQERVSFIAPVEVRSEVEEMQALARGVLRVLTGEEDEKEYGQIHG